MLRLEGGEQMSCERVVIACGAWTRKLAVEGMERSAIPRVRPVRGQMIALRMSEPHLCQHVVRAPDAYLVPKSSGRLIIGATMEERGFDEQMTAGGVFELLRGAYEAMPGIYDLDIDQMWCGFRPITLANEPVLGRSPAHPAVWFATGHGRNGILLTPATARLMSEAIEADAAPEQLRHFWPR